MQSQLSQLSLLEGHVHQLIYQHLCVNYPISERQVGFLPGRFATLHCDISAIATWIKETYLSLQPSKCYIKDRSLTLLPPSHTVNNTCFLCKVLECSDFLWPVLDPSYVTRLCAKTRKLIGLLYIQHASTSTLNSRTVCHLSDLILNIAQLSGTHSLFRKHWRMYRQRFAWSSNVL